MLPVPGPSPGRRAVASRAMGERIAVLVSGGGTNLQALLDDPAIRPSIALVMSRPPGRARARPSGDRRRPGAW